MYSLTLELVRGFDASNVQCEIQKHVSDLNIQFAPSELVHLDLYGLKARPTDTLHSSSQGIDLASTLEDSTLSRVKTKQLFASLASLCCKCLCCNGLERDASR